MRLLMWWAGRGGWSRKGVLQGARETCSFPVGLSGACCNGSDCTDLELQQAELAKDFDGQEFRVLFFSFFSLIAGVKFSASPSQPGGELVASGKLCKGQRLLNKDIESGRQREWSLFLRKPHSTVLPSVWEAEGNWKGEEWVDVERTAEEE